MRALFSFTGGRGHFFPTLPLARAMRDRGHDVLYACQEKMVAVVRAEDFAAVGTGGPTLLEPSARRPLAPVDRLAEESVVRDGFAGRLARQRAGPLLALARDWRPDLVVRDEVDFAAAVVAEALGAPHAGVAVLLAGGLVRPDVVAAPLAVLRAAYGLGPADVMGMLHRYLTIVPAPPSFRHPGDPLPRTAHFVRPGALDEADRGLSGHDVAQPGGRPTVYFTLGTIFHQESGDLFGRAVAGLSKLPADVVVTVGHEVEPSELGAQPNNVHIQNFLPLTEVLARAAVVVSHGGSGTVMGALSFGLPQVLLPMGADQPLNADRCTALGVAIVLDALASTPEDIREATASVLRGPSYRDHASAVQAEILSLPGTAYSLSLLEELAVTKAPVPRS